MVRRSTASALRIVQACAGRRNLFLSAVFALLAVTVSVSVFTVTKTSAGAENTSINCLPLEHLGYATYDKYVACRVTSPAGMRLSVGYPNKYNGKLGLTPGPTQDLRPFNWGVINTSSPGFDCTTPHSLGLVCNPNGQTAGPIDLGFEAVGDCGTSVTLVAKAVPVGSPNITYVNDGSWSNYTFNFPACGPRGPVPPTPPAQNYSVGGVTVTCLEQEYLGYPTYDKYTSCRVVAPAGKKFQVGYPDKLNGKLGLTPGPTQDTRPFNWGIISKSTPGWDCVVRNSWGLTCTPNGQPAGPVDIGFEAVGDCGTSAAISAKSVTDFQGYSADSSWARYDFQFPACPAGQAHSASSQATQPAGARPIINCLQLENNGYQTYDKYLPCEFTSPVGMRLSIGYPNKYNGKLGLTPGPTQDTRPFNWGIISKSSAVFDCTTPHSLGLVCNPKDQTTPGQLNVGFEAVGDCGTSVTLVAKAVPVGSPNITYVNDGSWSNYTVNFPACPAGHAPSSSQASQASSQPAGGSVSISCLPTEYLGYPTYDKYVACRFVAPAGQKFQVGYPDKLNGKLGLTPGPTQDTRPFNWGIISKSTPGWDCEVRNSWGLTCTPNGQPAGPVDIGFEAVGDCGTSAAISAKSVTNFQGYAADGSWARYDFQFPACPAQASSSSSSSFSNTTYQCSDGIDNDNDGAMDLGDFSCSGPTDNDETNPKAACQDGFDNDGDGKVDHPQDPGCSSKQDNDEWNSTGWLSSSTSSSNHWYSSSSTSSNPWYNSSSSSSYPWYSSSNSSNSYPWYNSSSSSYQHYMGFKLRHRASSYEVFPGGVITFEITVHNDTDRDITNVVIVNRYHPLLTVVDNGGGTASSGELRWYLGTIARGSSRMITYSMRIGDSCRPGQILNLEIEARGDNGFFERTSTMVGVIGTLPQTGNRWNKQSPYLKPMQQTYSGFFGLTFKPFW